MKNHLLRLAVAAAAAALATTASAQFRHDEKPHGMGKASPAPDTPVTERTPGRHDERPHGHSTAKAKKSGTKAVPAKKDEAGK